MSSPAKQQPLIHVTIKNCNEEEDNLTKASFKKNADVAAIKELIELEIGTPIDEQIVLFRGKHIAWRGMTMKDEAFQPLNTPDLQDIIEEAGEDGLRMAVIHKPFRLPKFMKGLKVEKDVNSNLKTGATLLHRAVRKAELGIVEEILDKPEFEAANQRDKYGQTALHTACTAWLREPVEILLTSKNRWKAISVSYSADWQARLMAEVEAKQVVSSDDVRAYDKEGNRLGLQWHGKTKELFEHEHTVIPDWGAEMRSKLNDNGMTKDDLIIITDKENQRYSLAWVGENAEINPVPEEASFPLKFESREKLVLTPSDPTKAMFPLKFEVMCFTAVRAKDAEGRNALHYIACWGDAEACRMLLAHEGFRAKDASAKDKRGFRPYELAVHMGHDDVAAQIKNFLESAAAHQDAAPAEEELHEADHDDRPSEVSAPPPAHSEEGAPLASEEAEATRPELESGDSRGGAEGKDAADADVEVDPE